MAQPDSSKGPQWKHALAGGTGGLVTSLVLHPLDVVKTRLQVQDGGGVLPVYRGTLDALRQIVRSEGWRALYSGLTPALAGNGLAWGIYFFAYNRAKERYQRHQRASGQQKLSPGMHLVSAAEAGAVVCFITNPVWVVKTRLQLQRRTLQEAAAAAAAAAGGSGAAVAAGAGQAAGAAGAVSAGQAAAGAAAAAAGRIPRPLLGGAAAAGSGAAAEACALEYRGFLHAFVQIARCEGIRGLYRGLLPSLLLVSHGAIQFAVYEELKHLAQGFSGFTRSLDSLSLSSSSSSSTGGGGSGSSSSSSASPSSKRRGGGDMGVGGGAQLAAPPPPTQRQLSPAEITACGALSKLVASVATYPSQVLRSRLQQRMDSRALQYTGVLDVVRKTLQREGLGGFYKGLAPNMLRVMPQSALTFLVYESVMRLLNPRPQQQQQQ